MTSSALAPSLLIVAVALVACHKKPETGTPAPAVTVAAAPASAPVATEAAEPTDAQREQSRKQALLDYATMEDTFIKDPKAQWASTAKSSSTFGDEGGKTPSEASLAVNATGPVDGKAWTNNQQDIGFDTLELGYDKPVAATAVRVVLPGGDGVEAISKLELQDVAGTWTVVWSGLSEVKKDERGPRTWFVRTFPKTGAPVKGVRITFANNVQSVYKVVDAVQLVGE